MAYTVRNSNNVVVATVADNSIDTSSTSVTLIGKNYVGYGQKANENLVYILENFAKTSAPTAPLTGQLWYDTSTNDLKIYNGSSFVQAIKTTANLAVTNLTASGTANITGNANVGNLGTATAIITTGNITTINSGLLQNGNSNVTVAANGNVSINAVGGQRLVLTSTGANITGTANISGNANVGNLGTAGLITATGNVSGGNLTTSGALSVTGNANVGNLGTATAIITTGNITTINSGLLQNGNSNVSITANGNVSINAVGGTRLVLTSTGANITGTANISGNANVGNLGTGTVIATTGNITTVNSGLLQNGNSNVSIAANSNVGISVTGTSNVLVVTSTGANIAGTLNAIGNANVGNLGTAGTVTASRLISNVTNGTAPFVVTSTTQVANLNVATAGSATTATTAGTVTTAAQPNITSTGTLTSLTVSGTITVNSSNNATAFANGGTNGTGNIGASGATFNTVFAKASTAQYADLAEKYWSDGDYEAGTVVKIGGNREITICDEDCSKDVFGCISQNPAYLMNDNNFENYQPVVLQGRSIIKIIGKISKGDRLVSAGNGCARKGLPEELSYQTEIGRAISDKNSEEISFIEAFISTK